MFPAKMMLILSINTVWLIASLVAASGPHSFPLPYCGTDLFLCDTFNGAWCIDQKGGSWCCDDGSGMSFRILLNFSPLYKKLG